MTTSLGSIAPRKRIAIVGSGAAGLGAAFALKDVHDIVLYEQDDRLGGHAHTVSAHYEGRPVSADVGFIVFNVPNYPNFVQLLDHLQIAHQPADMSFGFSIPGGVEWCSDLGGVFAQPRNAVNPRFLGMLAEMARFNAIARADLKAGRLGEQSLAEYLRWRGFGDTLRRWYLLPMGAAIWSSTEDAMLDYPAASFLRFFSNHHLLHVIRSGWRTITGGSQAYVTAIADQLGDRVRRGRRVAAISRTAAGVMVAEAGGSPERFDDVVIAAHSDDALALLADADEEERFFLGAIRYAPNQAYFHADESLMPTRRRAWAAWNYRTAADGADASVTYDMNRLQSISRQTPFFVTLNPSTEPDPERVYGTATYRHPQFDRAAMASQRQFNRIQGVRRTWFCGAWLGYGFHEDALRSGLRVALRLGGSTPWPFVEGDVTGGPWGARAGDDEGSATAAVR